MTMKRSLPLLALAAALAATTLVGCQSTSLNNAAVTQGVAAASLQLPPWPAECKKSTPHASIKVGDELRAVLVRERAALDTANATQKRCADFYDDLIKRLDAATAKASGQ